MPSGKMGYLITETKFDRNFPLVDSRNIEESFSFYEKNWEKIVSASKKFPKNLKKNFVFALYVLKVSVADLVKFVLSHVKSVTFFSRIFISHVEDFDLFGGFTDLVLFFQVSFCTLPTWIFQKISEILKLKKNKTNRSWICFRLYRIPRATGNMRLCGNPIIRIILIFSA